MAMSRPQPVSVLLVAATSAAFHGGAAVLFVPVLSFILLCWSGAPSQSTESVQTETGMVFALLAPLIATVFGFIAGAVMALAHNVFAQGQRKLAIEMGDARQVRAASFSNVA
jgi:hypothetical protein